MTKEEQAKTELDRLYPGLTNAEITAIQRERLKRSEAIAIDNDTLLSVECDLAVYGVDKSDTSYAADYYEAYEAQKAKLLGE